jgi:hypothetical protein
MADLLGLSASARWSLVVSSVIVTRLVTRPAG